MASSQLGQVDSLSEELSRRERENRRQREEMLKAALKLFSQKGFHNVAMHEIAKEAEFGMGTLYKYFKNKEDLYKALIMSVAQEFHHDLIQALEQELNPIRAIKNYVAVRRKLFSENLPLMRLYFAETSGASFNIKAGLDRDLLKLYNEDIEKLAGVFEQGIKGQVFRNLDPYQMALALEGTINAFLFQFLEDPARVHEEDLVLTATDIFFRGVLIK
jgi:AcrR family transcriptional regulator